MGSLSESTKRSGCSLDDLIALNDEIAALIRAGIPLEMGLDPSFSRRLGPLTERLRDRMRQGQSLSEALAADEQHLPPVYYAIVEAGLKAGRLPEALESLSEFSQSLAELKQRIALALFYPAIVLLATYGLFVGFVVFMVPRLEEVYRQFRLPIHGWMPLLRTLHDTVYLWGPGLFVAACVLWLWRGRSLTGNGAPWMWSIVANFHRAGFAGMLSLLLDHHVPLPEALRLAGAASGERRIRESSDAVAGDVESGERLAASLATRRAFSPFMRWMISSGEQQGALAATLRQVSDVYHRRALNRAESVKIVLPILLTVIVGGGVVLLYGLTLFVPLSDLLRDLTIEG